MTDLAAPAAPVFFERVLLPHRSVAHVHSYVVLDRVKETAQLPLRYLSDSNRTSTARSGRARKR